MSSMSPTPLPFLHSCFPLFPTQHAAIPGDPASCCWSGPLQHTHLHYCTHRLHLSARTYELPVNQAAAQCRPHCLSVVGVRSWMSVFVWMWACTQTDTGSRGWMRPPKYYMRLILTRLNIATKPLRMVCACVCVCAYPSSTTLISNQQQRRNTNIPIKHVSPVKTRWRDSANCSKHSTLQWESPGSRQ